MSESRARRGRQTLPLGWWARVLLREDPAMPVARGTQGVVPAGLEGDLGGATKELKSNSVCAVDGGAPREHAVCS